MSTRRAASPAHSTSSDSGFIPQENDEELLYEVIQITGERNGMYRVKWKGTDPKTGKPWPQDWVPKHDCTDDLVQDWKSKDKSKSIRSRSSKKSRASTATYTPDLPHSVAPEDSTPKAAGFTDTASKSSTSKSHPKTGTKRKREAAISAASSTKRISDGLPDVVRVFSSEEENPEDQPIAAKPHGKSKTQKRLSSHQPRKRRKVEGSRTLFIETPTPETMDLATEDPGELFPSAYSPTPEDRPNEDDREEEKMVEDALSEAHSSSPQLEYVEEGDAEDPSNELHEEEDDKPIAVQVNPKLSTKAMKVASTSSVMTTSPPKPKSLPTSKSLPNVQVKPTSKPRKSYSVMSVTKRVIPPQSYPSQDEGETTEPGLQLSASSLPPVVDAFVPPLSMKIGPPKKKPTAKKTKKKTEDSTTKEKPNGATSHSPALIPRGPPKDNLVHAKVAQNGDVRGDYGSAYTTSADQHVSIPSSESHPRPSGSSKRTNSIYESPDDVRLPEAYATTELGTEPGGTPPPSLEWEGPRSANKGKGKEREVDLLAPKPLRGSSSGSIFTSQLDKPEEVVSVFYTGRSTSPGSPPIQHAANVINTYHLRTFEEQTPNLSPAARKILDEFDRKIAKLERKNSKKIVREEKLVGAERNGRSKQVMKRDSPKGQVPNDSYSGEVVPETEPSQETSQEKELKLPKASTGTIKASTSTSKKDLVPISTSGASATPHTTTISVDDASNGNPSRLPVPRTPSSLGRQGSHKSRMKPRTPRSGSSSFAEVARNLERIIPPKFELSTLTEEGLMDGSPPAHETRGEKPALTQSSVEAVNGSAPERSLKNLIRSSSLEDAPSSQADVDTIEPYPTATSTGTSKSLRPIPMLSPSAFQPHLQGVVDPIALPSSAETIEDPSLSSQPARRSEERKAGKGKKGSSRGRAEQGGEDEPMSSIESFESPDKRRRDAPGRVVLAKKDKGKGRERSQSNVSSSHSAHDLNVDDDDFELSIIEKGILLAEAVKKKQSMYGLDEGNSRRKILAIVAQKRARSRSREVATISGDEMDERGAYDDHEAFAATQQSEPPIEQDEDVQRMEVDIQVPHNVDELDLSKDTTTATTAPSHTECPSNLTFQEVSRAFDSASQGKIVIDLALLREEEEETTQDILAGLEAYRAQSEAADERQRNGGRGLDKKEIALPTVKEESPSVEVPDVPMIIEPPSENDASEAADGRHRARSAVPNIVIQNPSRAPSTLSSPEGHEGNITSLPTPHAVIPPQAEPPRRIPQLRSRSRSKTPAVAPPTTRKTRAQSQEPEAARKNKVKEKIAESSSSSLLTAKSEEVARLDSQLTSERSKNTGLQRQLDELRAQLEAVASSSKTQSEDLMRQLEEARSELVISSSKWDVDRRLLAGQLEAANKGKASAEKDREFIRDQYMQASAFAGDLRDENRELKQRATIAEGQATTGVNIIKATFELRVKTLEEDLRLWRKMAEFLMEKDKRTNDDMRRRAAEEPELRARLKKAKEELELVKEKLVLAEDERDDNAVELEEKVLELQKWQEETARLNVELAEANYKLEILGRNGEGESIGNGHEFVYRCLWRVGEGNQTCPAVFSRISELQDHLFTAKHLEEDRPNTSLSVASPHSHTSPLGSSEGSD